MKNEELNKTKNSVNLDYPEEYAVTGICIGCGKCLYVCPADCIVHDGVPYYIDASKCQSCGSCRDVCPVGAVSVL